MSDDEAPESVSLTESREEASKIFKSEKSYLNDLLREARVKRRTRDQRLKSQKATKEVAPLDIEVLESIEEKKGFKIDIEARKGVKLSTPTLEKVVGPVKVKVLKTVTKQNVPKQVAEFKSRLESGSLRNPSISEKLKALKRRM